MWRWTEPKTRITSLWHGKVYYQAPNQLDTISRFLKEIVSFKLQAQAFSTCLQKFADLPNQRPGLQGHGVGLVTRKGSPDRPGKASLVLSPGPMSGCCHQKFRNILQCGPELWSMGDLLFRKQRRPALLRKERKLTWSHSRAFLLFVSRESASAEQKPFFGHTWLSA